MSLTKDERYSVYAIMLAEIENPSMYLDEYLKERSSAENGLCWMYKMVFGDDHMYHNLKEMFPELIQFTQCEWWDHTWRPDKWPVRIAALKQCIEETSDF